MLSVNANSIRDVAKGLALSLFLFALNTSMTAPTFAADANDDVIDGYELPSMFESDVSTPIPDQSAKKNKAPPLNTQRAIKKHKPVVSPDLAPAMPMPIQGDAEYENAFVPVQKLPTKTVTNVVNSWQVDVLKPVKRPFRETKPAPMSARYTNAQIKELTSPTVLQRVSATLPLPRSIKVRRRSSNVGLIMPAVPPIEVQATPLAQPEISQPETLNISLASVTEDAEIVSTSTVTDISVSLAVEPLIENDTNTVDLSIAMLETEAPAADKADDAQVFDTTQSDKTTLFFELGSVELTDEMKTEIDQTILTTLQNKNDIRVEIQAYAEPVDDSPSSARRVSLARALALRTYLLSKKLESHRIDVRALGSNTNILPIDRLDVELIH